MREFTEVDKRLQQRVGLEELYPYRLKRGLTLNGEPCAGFCRLTTGEIFLNADLCLTIPGSEVRVYLHEVAHIIAAKYDLNDSPDSCAHNPYFATLLAVMYRRANMLDALKVYDFCDTAAGQRFYLYPDEPMPDDEALIKRFCYILRRSAKLARSKLTIEQIAKQLRDGDSLNHWWLGEEPNPPMHTRILWRQVLFGALCSLGVSSAAFAAVTAALL